MWTSQTLTLYYPFKGFGISYRLKNAIFFPSIFSRWAFKEEGTLFIILSVKDFKITDLLSLENLGDLSNNDFQVLKELYLPIIGCKALGLYFALRREKKTLKVETFLKKAGLSLGELTGLLPYLEGVSLARTFIDKLDKSKVTIETLKPCGYGKFFDSIALRELLKEKIGEKEYQTLVEEIPPRLDTEKLQEVTSKFNEVYTLKDANVNEPKKFYKKSQELRYTFDEQAFLRAFLSYSPNLETTTLTSKELRSLAEIQAIFGVDEAVLAEILYQEAFDLFKPVGKRVDFMKLQNALLQYNSSPLKPKVAPKSVLAVNSPLKKDIKDMEELTPIDYLTKFQGGHIPASSDIALIKYLVNEMGLNSAVCNALMLYLITTNKGIIRRPLAEKIAASLVRNGIETAYDAVEFLTTVKKENKKPVTKEEAVQKVTKVEPVKDDKKEEKDHLDEELDELLEGI